MRPRFLYLALAIVLVCPLASAQWVQTNGPYGGRITCFAVGGANIFVGTSDGEVYRTTNGGTIWTNLNGNGLVTRTDSYVAGINALLVNGTNLFVGVGIGVYLSTNNGASWTDVSNGLGNGGISCLASDGSTLFAGKRDSYPLDCAVYRSTNNGSSWTCAGAGLTDPDGVFALVVKDSLLFAGRSGVFVSTNNGNSWAVANDGLKYQDGWPPYVSTFLVDGGRIFAGTSQGVFLSTNNGTSWTVVDTSVERQYSGAIATIGADLFVSTGNLFLSTNAGASWSTLKHGWVGAAGPLATSETNLWVGTAGAGVFLSRDKGTSWAPASDGLSYLSVSALASSGANLYAGTNGAGVFRSTDNGTSWTAANAGLPDGSVVFKSGTNLSYSIPGGGSPVLSTSGPRGPLPGIYVNALLVNGTNLIAGTRNGLFLSTNNGASWSSANAGLPYSEVNALAASGTNLFAVSSLHYGGQDGGGELSGGVFLSNDNGRSWTAFNQGLPKDSWMDTTQFDYVNCLVSSGQNLLAGTERGVFLSANNSSDWTAVVAGLPVQSIVTSFAVSRTHVYAGTGGNGVFVSTDNGASWTAVNTGLPKRLGDTTQYCAVSALAVSGIGVFVGLEDLSTGKNAGAFLSTDNGRSWTAVDSGFTPGGILSLLVSGKFLFAGIGSSHLTIGEGVWRRPLSDLTSVKPTSSEIPTEFILEQNYPNPFNPSTTIRYGLPERSVVSLTVFNTLGQQVEVLQDEEQEAGYHEVKFDASGLSSGVYFYRLRAGDFVETKRLLLVR
jgi:hypothetical protein